jgi:hypothetical protein
MHSKISKLHSAISSAMDGMSTDELSHRPHGKWSAAEILEHLNLTYVGTIKNLERRLSEGKPTSSTDRAKERWSRIVVTRLGYMPSGRKSPERAMPRGAAPDQIAMEVLQNVVRMDEVLSQCEARFPGKPIADHPALGPLTAAEWRGFHLTHGCHHAKQIVVLKKKLLLHN